MKTIFTLLTLIFSFYAYNQSSDLEKKVYEKLNNYKLKFNGDSTDFSENISTECRNHSQLMLKKKELFHATTNFIGEIVQQTSKFYCTDTAYLCNVDELAQKILTNFLNSPPHKENLENDYKTIGVGILEDERGKIWVTIRFW